MKLRSCFLLLAAGAGVALQFQACHVDYAVDENFFSHLESGGDGNGVAGAGDTSGTAADGPGASSNTGGDGATGAVNGSGGTGGTSVVLPSCGDGEASCLEPAPEDWSGPFAVAFSGGTGSPSCAGTGYESQVFSMNGELDEGTATCDCECGDPSGMSCGNTVEVQVSANMNVCYAAVGSPFTLTMGSCTSISSDGWYSVGNPEWSASGGCTSTPTVDIDTPHWTSKAVACEANALDGACSDSQLCLPKLQSPLDTWCIYQEGAQDCPAGPYSVQSTYYEDFTDNRSCTDCTCGSASGHCDGNVAMGDGCPGDFLVADVPFAGCADLDVSGTWGATASLDVNGPDGSCPPIGGELDGEVSYTGEVTVCCLP